VDPHKASHTAVVISPAEEPLGQLRVRAADRVRPVRHRAAGSQERCRAEGLAVHVREIHWQTTWPCHEGNRRPPGVHPRSQQPHGGHGNHLRC